MGPEVMRVLSDDRGRDRSLLSCGVEVSRFSWPVLGRHCVRATFYGVRGSTPSPSEANRRYGGNTSSLTVEVGDDVPMMFDIGTGARQCGVGMDEPFVGSIFVTHLHWDHIQGLPFFGPMLRPGASATFYGPVQPEGTLREAIDCFVRPPLFPVTLDQLPCEFKTIAITDDSVEVGLATVVSRQVPHVGETNGYRVEHEGKSMVYIPDHQQPMDPDFIDPGVVELCQDADVLIHDAQYTPDEFVIKSDWGHCTIDYAIHVAHRCSVRKLVLFHHDPSHDDDTLDALFEMAIAKGAALGLEIVGAFEGLELNI
jgi:phosphoribosyl 1,2-cyclic phosphodiesterase